MGLIGVIPATATADQVVPVEAVVTSGSNGAPLIECAWALTDQATANGKTTWVDHMQYGQDDNPSAVPAGPICQTVVGTTFKPIQANQTSPSTAPIHIQVLPNIDDDPTQRYIELWLATDATSSGTIVNWKVYHPDGSFKVQVDGSNYTAGSVSSKCAGPAGMFDAAVATGQIEALAAVNTTPAHDSLRDWCAQNAKDFYYGAFGLSKHQPYGKYRIDATVIKPSNGGQSTLTYFIEVLPVMFLAKDFQNVSFGPIQAGNDYQVNGDVAWNTSTTWTDSAPTLQNQGNQGLSVAMAYTNLCLMLPTTPNATRDCGPGKEIESYDGGLGTSIASVEHRYPVAHTRLDSELPSLTFTNFLAQQTSGFGPRYRTLCPNDLAKVDFSIHAPQTLESGHYAGKVNLKVIASPLCNTDMGQEYAPPFNDPQVIVNTSYTGVTPMSTGYWTT